MKKIITILLMITLCAYLAACGKQREFQNDLAANDSVVDNTVKGDKEEVPVSAIDSQTNENMTTDISAERETEKVTEKETEKETEKTTEMTTETTTKRKKLVVYFSVTGNTKAIAESIADGLKAELYEIVPKEPYTSEDLNYNNNNSRSTLEMNDSSARPEISRTVNNFEQYDTVFIGYPIWWGEAPRILDTFVESYDFTGKKVIPFCTSASSGIGSSAATLEKLAGSGNWMDGQRFRANESADKVMEWAGQFN